MIRLRGVSKRFLTRRGEITILKEVDIDLPERGLYFFVGKSGSGKSTFLNLLSGVIGDYSGTIEVDGTDIGTFSEDQWNAYRNEHIGVVFQNYGLFERETAIDNILVPTLITERNEEETKRNATELLQYVGLKGHENSKVSNLSGGEKQRIAIARALINHPKVILADEPTGNLDRDTSYSVLNLFRTISEECLVCVVSHDLDGAKRFGDGIFEIVDGNIKKTGDETSALFTVTFKMHGSEKVVRDLPEKELVGFVSEQLKLIKETEEPFSLDIISNNRLRKERRPAEAKNDYKQVLGRKKLSLRNVVRLSRFKPTSGWMKMICGMLLLSILMVLACGLWNLYTYRPAKVIYQYVAENEIPFLEVSAKVSFRDSRGENQERQISSGPWLLSKLLKTIDEQLLIPELGTTEIVRPDRRDLCSQQNVHVLVTDTLFRGHKIVLGNHPKASDEIAITQQLAKELELQEPILGAVVQMEGRYMTIVGVLEVDYGATENSSYRGGDDSALFVSSIENYVALVSPSYIRDSSKSDLCIELPCSNLSLYDWESQYLSEGGLPYGAIEESMKCHLVEGRMPVAPDEVLLSTEVYRAEELFGTKNSLSLIPFHDEKYHFFYSDKLNLETFFPNGVKVVGLFDQIDFPSETVRGTEVVPQVLFVPEMFQAVRESFYSDYAYGAFRIIVDETLTEKKIDELLINGFRFSEPNAERILDFFDTLFELRVYFLVAFIAVVVCIFAVALLTISISIRDRGYLLGVLRTVGYSKGDFVRLFLFETLLMGIVAVVLSASGFYGAKLYANADYATRILLNRFDILVFGIKKTALLEMLCLLLCIIASMAPIARLSRKKPYDLICMGGKEQ